MSLFSWFSTRKEKKATRAAPPISSGLSRMDSTKPFNAKVPPANAQPGNRKQERMARRELLYAVVREAMVRAGVLSSSYKFKVLSLDARGRQFLVMVDLAQGAGGDTARLAEIEAMVAQMAKGRHDILVSAVYWRSNDHVAIGDPAARAAAARRSPVSRPSPLAAAQPQAESSPAPQFAASQPAELEVAPERHPEARFDPLLPEEVAAFKQALAAGVNGAQAAAAAASRINTGAVVARGFDGAPKAGPQSYTLLTGFEDTEMPEEATAGQTALSATQYGDLR